MPDPAEETQVDSQLTAQANVLDQNCESRQALDRIADKWTSLCVYALVSGPKRHGELRREVQGITQKMLTQTLRSMERDGLVQRTVFEQVPPRVEYALTPLGMTLQEPLVAICRWAMDHLPEVQAARARAERTSLRVAREALLDLRGSPP